MIKGICFDLDGVYFTKAGVSWFVQKLTEECGDKQKVIDAVIYGPDISAYRKGELTEEAFWETVNQRLGIKHSVSEYADMLVSHYEIDENIHKILLKTKRLGYMPLICSNNYQTRVNTLQKKFHFLDNFAAAVFSYEVGAMKPDIKIFQALIDKSGLKPKEIVYADDMEIALSGARALGINAALFTTFENYCQYLISLGVPL